MTRTRHQHALAVATIAAVAVVFGAGFAATKIAMAGGLSVGAVLSLRFLFGSAGLYAFIRARGIRFDRQSVKDGLVLGAILVTIFWLQTDGLQYTTTSKSGFITSLYVPFTPLVALLLGERVRLAHGISAVIATLGLLLLVHIPGGLLNGWNRGDFETLACAVLCAFHLSYTGRFSKRSNGWLLAFLQVAVTGAVSIPIALLMRDFHRTWAALHNPWVLGALAFMVCFTTIFSFWGQSTMQAYLSSTETAVIFSLEPVTAALVGTLFLHEVLTPSQLLGALLILLAMIGAELLPRIVGRTSDDSGLPATCEAASD